MNGTERLTTCILLCILFTGWSRACFQKKTRPRGLERVGISRDLICLGYSDRVDFFYNFDQSPETMTSNISAQPSLFGDPSIDHALAGLGAGTVATLVMHPLDLVKVRFQLADSKPHPNSHLPLHKTKPRLGTGVYMALKDAVVVDGWKGLYRGLVPNLVGGASSWGLYFLLQVAFSSTYEA